MSIGNREPNHLGVQGTFEVVSTFKITTFLRLVSDEALQKHQVGLVLRKEEGQRGGHAVSHCL